MARGAYTRLDVDERRRRLLEQGAELFEALTLAQTQKVTSFPIVLFGTEYWGGLIDWLRDTMLHSSKINEPDLDMLKLTDDVDEAVEIVTRAERERAADTSGTARRPE